jgi:pimeloyl-ACP methyl ester carboxylesterase
MTKSLNPEEDAGELAEQLFGEDAGKRAWFTGRLLDIYGRVRDRDFLLIHNPGGWGTTPIDELLQWERSIVEGVSTTIEKLGYSCQLVQYFRSGTGYREIIRDIREQMRFFEKKAGIMAAELDFITRRLSNLRIIMIGVSQGAAFSNAVTQRLNGNSRIYDIELGIPFPYRSRRVITERTLALDSNGLMPDALMEWDVPTIVTTYLTAPFRWIKYRLQGKRIKYTYCINVPGHDYNWDYPEVQRQVEDFLDLNFGNTVNAEVEEK